MKPTPLLELSGVSAGYGEMQVLNDIDLAVFPSEIVALVGSNGAGKTTLLRVLSRLLVQRSGQILFNGASIAQDTSDQVFRKGMVQVPEGRQLFGRMSVQDNLLMGAYHRRKRDEVAGDLQHVYELFPQMAERRRQMAASMSGGEQQMCAMARSMMARPTLLMVDEMSLGLAPIIVDRLMQILVNIRDRGTTVLLVEQDIHLALETADRGYVVESGRIVRQGRASELIADPALQRAYLGL